MARAIDVTFTIRDGKNKTSKTVVHVPTGFSIAQYGEFAVAMGQVIANLLDGEIMDISVSIPINLSGATIRAVAQVTADIAKKVIFGLGSAVAGLFSRQSIPTYDEENHTLAGSDQLDFADPDVAAYIALLETGSGTAPVDARNNDITDVTYGREVFRSFN
jgi:hypothetical protein